MTRKVGVWMMCITVVVVVAGRATASMADDEKECADQMAELAACIPFVSGSAKQPTKECCDNTIKLRSAKPKCLCVLIKESTDPSIGLPINTTLALQMPAACKIDAKVSDCPTLLNLPADSADAKIFKVDGPADSSSSSTPPSDHSTSASTSTTPPSAGDSTKAASSTAAAPKTTLSFILLLIAPISSLHVFL